MAYLIFVSSTMSAVTYNVSREAWVVMTTAMLLPLVCLNDFSFLSFMSIGAIVCLLLAFATVFAYGMLGCNHWVSS